MKLESQEEMDSCLSHVSVLPLFPLRAVYQSLLKYEMNYWTIKEVKNLYEALISALLS
jgi:hypothetical protein